MKPRQPTERSPRQRLVAFRYDEGDGVGRRAPFGALEYEEDEPADEDSGVGDTAHQRGADVWAAKQEEEKGWSV